MIMRWTLNKGVGTVVSGVEEMWGVYSSSPNGLKGVPSSQEMTRTGVEEDKAK